MALSAHLRLPSHIRAWLPDRFFGALVLAVLVALVLPASGAWAGAVHGVTQVAIALMFFFLGCRLSLDAMRRAALHWRFHLAAIVATFALFPVWVGFGQVVAPSLLSATLWTGLLVLSAMPSTIQSSIVYSGLGGGNVPASVTAATLSNLVGLVVTPLLIGFLLHAQGLAIGSDALMRIALQLVLPFVSGQFAQSRVRGWAERHRPAITLNERATIVLAVYGAFSAATLDGIWERIPASDLLILCGVSLVIFGLMLGTSWALARVVRLQPADRTSLVFCGTQKSLASGVPIAMLLFRPEDLVTAVLPLMIYHQLQLLLSAGLAQRLRRHDCGEG